MSKKMQIRVALVLVFVSVLAFAGYQLLGQQPQLQTQAVTKFWAMIIDNNRDQVALTVQGHSTQTSSLIVAENSAGTDQFTVSNVGAVVAASSVTGDSLVCTTSGTFGGGYGATGATISTAGVGTFNGVLTTDGALTADSTAIGGGYGSTGATISTAGVVQADGALTIGSTGTFAGDVTISADATGGNAGAKSEVVGLPRIKFVDLAQGTNGSIETTSYVDDSPTGEYAPIDADVTEAEGSGDSIYKFGASSYKAAFAATAATGDGFRATIVGDNLEANESIGLLLYSNVSIASADLQILLTDDGGARNFNIGAISASTWTWLEVDISALALGTGDVVTEFGVTLTAQGEAALGTFNLYMDVAYKWDATDEDALGAAIVQDGVINVLTIPTAFGTNNTLGLGAELTEYFVHYETGNDFIVWITDQSANEVLALVAY